MRGLRIRSPETIPEVFSVAQIRSGKAKSKSRRARLR